MSAASQGKKSSPLLIAGAWIIVILPTLWGLNYTFQNALKIFAKPAPPVAAAPTTAIPAK